MTGRPGCWTMEMNGGSSAPYTPCFLHCLIGVETEGVLDYQGRAGDHFHCTVEPSPGHIRCRIFAIFAIAMPIADPRNRAISGTRESDVALRFKGAMESR